MCTCGNSGEYVSRQIMFNDQLYELKTCEKCGFVRTMPQHHDGVDIYETGHYEVKPFFIIPFLINLPDYLYIWVILISRGVNVRSRLLDFGCGKGFFLLLLKKLGYKDLFGVETSISRARYAANLTKIDVSSEYYNGGKIMGHQYDCITMLHVLEHIPNPFEFLPVFINNTLNSGGKLFVEIPNIDSTASRWAGKTWAHFTPHFHVNHFTPESLISFCNANNFNYEFVGTFSFYNSAMGMTSALLSFFGYRGSIFEDLKNKRISVIVSFLVLLPITIFLEIILSLFAKKGSVIKFIIRK
jgi:SAM-dependent methyltransferase